MKQLVLLLFCILPLTVPAQDNKNLNIEEIKKDDVYIALQAKMKPVEEKMDIILNEYRQASPDKKNNSSFKASFDKRYTEALNRLTSLLQSFISANTDSYVSLLTLNELVNSPLIIDVSVFANLYKSLSEPLKKTDMGVFLGNQIFSNARTPIGMVAPDFTQNDPEGRPVKLSDFKGKYVLIDFWASWCSPCRKENPKIVNIYDRFKDKNFEILGVSLDNPNDKCAWLKAITDDKLTWTQVSDLQGWLNQAALLYGVGSIPQNFLIDPQGVIIANNLSGDDLIQTLNTTLH